MTIEFDKRARDWLIKNSNLKECEYNGEAVKNMYVLPIEVKNARPYISTFHYSKTTPDSTQYAFAGYYKDKLAGIVLYGTGSNNKQYSYLINDIQKGQYIELTRLWSPDGMPKNTESKLISESLKMLPKEIKLVISFADSSKNHVGYIYQATNWYYVGKTNSTTMLIDEEGIIRHNKSINIYRLRHDELKTKTSKEIMDIYGWRKIEGGVKHRYCYLLGNKKEKKIMFNKIKDKIMEYPK